jgi:ElaB/YqjD/DUF883 family membrane-anchored ribosome-binding protein
MNNLQHSTPRALDGAGRHLRDVADDAADNAGLLLERGQRLARRTGKHARRRLHALADFAEDAGDRATLQARRLRRQVRRHPLATLGVTVAAVGIVLLALRGWKQHQAAHDETAPDHHYFADSDEDREPH